MSNLQGENEGVGSITHESGITNIIVEKGGCSRHYTSTRHIGPPAFWREKSVSVFTTASGQTGTREIRAPSGRPTARSRRGRWAACWAPRTSTQDGDPRAGRNCNAPAVANLGTGWRGAPGQDAVDADGAKGEGRRLPVGQVQGPPRPGHLAGAHIPREPTHSRGMRGDQPHGEGSLGEERSKWLSGRGGRAGGSGEGLGSDTVGGWGSVADDVFLAISHRPQSKVYFDTCKK